jgi:hypothetical protein
LLRGKKSRFGIPEYGYFSQKVREARLALSSEFTLDGELYTLDTQAKPITVTQGGKASFLKL